MDILSRILDIAVESFGINSFEFLLYLILLGAFLWLAKELRAQQTEERALRKEVVEKSITAYSLILFEGNKHKDGENTDSFYQSVYASFPFIDYKISEKILSIMDQDWAEEEMILQILDISKEEVLSLSKLSGNQLVKTKLLVDDIGQFFTKLRRIFGPFFTSFFIIYSALILLVVSSSGETRFWMIIKPISFFIGCLLILFFFDLLSEQKLTRFLTIQILGMIISSAILIEASGVVLVLALIFFVIFLVLFVFGAHKRRPAP